MTDARGVEEGVARLAELLEESRRETAVLALSTCAVELQAWFEHARSEPWTKANRESLLLEWETSQRTVGTRLRTVIEAELADFDASARMAFGGHSSAELRRKALARCQALLGRLRSVVAVQAAWADLVEIATDAKSDQVQVAACCDVFLSLLDWAEHDARSVSRKLASVLRDNAWTIAEVRHKLGRDGTCGPGVTPMDEAGLSVLDRLELCHAFLSMEPSRGSCVVWMAFAPADLRAGYVELGPATFFEARWVIPNARNDHGQDFPHRAELREVLDVPEGMDADRPRVVLLRIDLGDRAVAGAIDHARSLAAMLLNGAAVTGRGRRWLPYGWESLIVDGRAVWTSRFVPPHQRDEHTIWGHERTAVELEELGPRFTTTLVSSSLPDDLEEAARCMAAAAESLPAEVRSRVILYDRAVEMIAAHAELPSARDLCDQAAARWPEAALRGDLLYAVEVALAIAAEQDRGTSDPNRLDRRIRTSERAGSYHIDLEAAYERRDELIEVCAESSRQPFVAKMLSTLDDSNSYFDVLRLYEVERDLLSSRRRRVRNALTHGNPSGIAVIRSVDAFARYLADHCFITALDAFGQNEPLASRLHRDDARRRQDETDMRSGTSYLEILRRVL